MKGGCDVAPESLDDPGVGKCSAGTAQLVAARRYITTIVAIGRGGKGEGIAGRKGYSPGSGDRKARRYQRGTHNAASRGGRSRVDGIVEDAMCTPCKQLKSALNLLNQCRVCSMLFTSTPSIRLR
ncbi:hypothetical protein HaLaN_24478 [Haematococcus lacustris]|uniref:Uncharacterized protein n=1 Tax=Haematococcus lacustris TaxID=44745 RepID=A0A699ZUH3_HAELA|nr:hypothetical protein HaLaN_24478 [Haematococcus lacustris]